MAVIGGGQAGLSMSFHLMHRGIDHVVIEAKQAGGEWRDRRWDSFCLVTPNWQCRLPGFPYSGAEPDGFMVRDEITRYLDEYVKSFGFPLVERTAATRLRRRDDGRFLVTTTAGEFTADQVVVATGPYQVPRTPRVARRYRGRDVVAWLDDMGYYRRAISDFADADTVRFRANHYVTGRDGGHDIDLRAFAAQGMRLYGRLAHTTTGGAATFADDLGGNLDAADAVSESIKDSIDAHIAASAITAPHEPRYPPVWAPTDPGGAEHTKLDLGKADVTAVVWATGFGADYRWIEVPVFDGRGYPTHLRGVTSCPGLYFLGLPWQHTWGSGRFVGVGADAGHLLRRIATYGAPAEVSWIAGTPASTFPARDDDWTAPRSVA